MKKPVAEVSDHALLRYLERVLRIDVEAHRCEVGRKVDRAMVHPGACGVRVGGFTYKLRGQVVTTVVPSDKPSHRTPRRRPKGAGDG